MASNNYRTDSRDINRRYGVFEIPEEKLLEIFKLPECTCGGAEDDPDRHSYYCELVVVNPLREFLANTMIVRAEDHFCSRSISYTGLNSKFDVCKEGEPVPHYRLHVISDAIVVVKDV